MGYNEFSEIENFVKKVYDELDSLIKESIEKYGIVYPNSTSTQTERINLKSREVIIEYNGAILKDKIKIIIEYWIDSVLKPSCVVINIKTYDKDSKIIKEEKVECYPFNPAKVSKIIETTIAKLENYLIDREDEIIRNKIKKQFEKYNVIVDEIIITDPSEIEITTHIYGTDYVNFKGYIDSNGNFILEKVEIECSEETTREMVEREMMPKIAEFIKLFKLIP
ncbi:MAG TPA: hypothetical protein EYH22_00920 [Candidatus Nanopusillus sp.]|nr:hypothetical protein [Candidatus Nanopusillus sp.]